MKQKGDRESSHPIPSVLIRKNNDGKILKYDVLKEIGKGGFGIVYSAIERQSKKKVALKCTPKSKLYNAKIESKLINEMTIHESLDHPNIVKFLGSFHDEHYIYFILELCEGGNVLEYIKNYNYNSKGKSVFKGSKDRNSRFYNDQSDTSYLPEFEVIKITRQILKALDYLHSKARVIHRDIKLQNFLMTSNGIVKLSDFGLSVKFEDVSDKSSVISICGTPNYISPEVIDRDSHTSAVDIWGVGVIVFLMLTGQRPFKSANNKKTFERIRQVHYDWPSYPVVSEQAKSFVDSILKKNPLERPSAKQLLKHSFLNGEKASNNKANSFDASIKFSVPNARSPLVSISTLTSTSVSPSVLSNTSNSPSNSNYNQSPSKDSGKPSYSPNYLTLNSKNLHNRSISPSRPVKYANMDLPNKSSINLPKRSQSPSRPFFTTMKDPSNNPSILSNNQFQSPNFSLLPNNIAATSNPAKYPKHHFVSSKSPYQMYKEGKSNQKVSEMVIPDIQLTNIDEEIWFEEHCKKLQKTKSNDDLKNELSTSIIIKATVETVEEAAMQAIKQNNFFKPNKNSYIGAMEMPTKSAISPKIQFSPIKGRNRPDYHINFAIKPSPHSSAFPSNSVLLFWDYSSRYGLGYILYNGCVGVCFNDLSRIIMEPTERFAQFYSKPNSKMEVIKLENYSNETKEILNMNQKADGNSSKKSIKNDNKNQSHISKVKKDTDDQRNGKSNTSNGNVVNTNNIENNSKDIASGNNDKKTANENDSSFSLPNKKKILIVKHFAKNLKKIATEYLGPSLSNYQEDSDVLYQKMKTKQLDYIKYWGTNKKDGILFKMNGKSIQASFTDKTSLYICDDTKNVIYDDTNVVYKVSLRDLVGNNKMNSIQSKLLIVKELGKNLE